MPLYRGGHIEFARTLVNQADPGKDETRHNAAVSQFHARFHCKSPDLCPTIKPARQDHFDSKVQSMALIKSCGRTGPLKSSMWPSDV